MTITTLTIANGSTSGDGGIYAAAALTLKQANVSGSGSANLGGAVLAHNLVTITQALFGDNVADSGAGIGTGGGMDAGRNVTITRGLFQANHAINPNSAGGGGLWANNTLNLTGTQFLSNTASNRGGGVCSSFGLSATHTVFVNNTAVGSGIFGENGTSLAQTTFRNNLVSSFGGAINSSGPLTVTRSAFVSNAAFVGGAVAHDNGNASLANTLLGRNTAILSGTALYFGKTGHVQLDYLTIGSATTVVGAAVYVDHGSADVRNTIVARHTVGLQSEGGAVTQDYNLFYGNGTNIVGSVTGGLNNASGDPQFIDAAHDNYHLGVGSAAIDRGLDVGIRIDFDGDARPFGKGFDIGFDESTLRAIYLPLVSK